MPRAWYDRHSVNQMEDGELKNIYRRILADKKPYFMRYIYPDLMKQYNDYIHSSNRNAMREFDANIDELENMDDKSEAVQDFLRYYHRRMPVGMNDCVMNRICNRFEAAFDSGATHVDDSVKFDYRKLKSGVPYTGRQYNAILSLHKDYNKRLQSYARLSYYERLNYDEVYGDIVCMSNEFMRECDMLCQNKYALCDILLDICYRKGSTKKFIWDMYADTVIENLLAKNNNEMRYPCPDTNGYITYYGQRFSVKKVKLEDEDEHCFE